MSNVLLLSSAYQGDIPGSEGMLAALTDSMGHIPLAGASGCPAGAERQAALAAPKYAARYPSAYVLIWGLAFSAVLVVNFLPAFRRLSHRANVTIDTILPILPPGSDRWQARLQERKDLADLLKVTSGAKDVITSAIRLFEVSRDRGAV